MIKIAIERTFEVEFYLDEARDVAGKLASMGYELERGATIEDVNLSPKKLKALLDLLRGKGAKSETRVVIETGE